MIDLYKLKIFWVVVGAGSFSNAAEQLYITQSAVSQHIKDLEASLGETLFERGWRGVTLTAYGETLARYARDIFALVAQAERELINVTRLSSGKVSIGVTPVIGIYRAPEWVQRFRARYPQLTVTMQTGSPTQIGHDVLTGRLDFGLIEGDIDESHTAKLKSLTLEHIEHQAVIGVKHALWNQSREPDLALDTLREYSLILPEPHSPSRLWLEQTLRQHGIDPKVGAEFDNLESMKRVVMGGMCLAILPPYVVQDELAHDRLRAVKIEGDPFVQALRLIYTDSQSFSPLTRAFLSELTQFYPFVQTLLDSSTPNDRRYSGEIERLRSPQRLALMEVDRVVELALEGIEARSALDVGTGSGLFAQSFAAKGLSVAGVDLREDMLEAARQYVPTGVFRMGRMEALPFADGEFDLVFLGHVLHEADDLALTLREARRTARVRVVVLEWPHTIQEYGPPLDHRLKPEQVEEAAILAGFRRFELITLTHLVLYRLSSVED